MPSPSPYRKSLPPGQGTPPQGGQSSPITVAPSPFAKKPLQNAQEPLQAPKTPEATPEPTPTPEPVAAPPTTSSEPKGHPQAPTGSRYGLSPLDHPAASDYVRAVARASLDHPEGTSTRKLTSEMEEARKEWELLHPSPEEIPDATVEGHSAPSEEEALDLIENATPETLATIANRLSLMPGAQLRKLKEQLGPLSPEAQSILDRI